MCIRDRHQGGDNPLQDGNLQPQVGDNPVFHLVVEAVVEVEDDAKELGKCHFEFY